MTYPLGEDPLDGKPCEKCPDYATNCAVGCDREGDGHDSDCATHNEPAYPNGGCDCSPVSNKDLWDTAHRLFMMSECRERISTRSLAEVAGLVSRAADTIKNLEIALRIKTEEHDSERGRIDVALGIEDNACNELEITLQVIEELKADAKRGQQLAVAVMLDNMGRG